jgi:hypothetical protein
MEKIMKRMKNRMADQNICQRRPKLNSVLLARDCDVPFPSTMTAASSRE